MGLSDKIQDQETRAKIADECAQLIDQQVAAKKGLSGVALKTAYRAIKGLGAGYIPKALRNLMPQVLEAMDPMWDAGLAAGDPVAHLSQNSSETADVLLGVTDTKISKARNKVVVATYKKVRNSIKDDVEAAVPGLAQIFGSYA